jgi:hypothetical protein
MNMTLIWVKKPVVRETDLRLRGNRLQNSVAKSSQHVKQTGCLHLGGLRFSHRPVLPPKAEIDA